MSEWIGAEPHRWHSPEPMRYRLKSEFRRSLPTRVQWSDVGADRPKSFYRPVKRGVDAENSFYVLLSDFIIVYIVLVVFKFQKRCY